MFSDLKVMTVLQGVEQKKYKNKWVFQNKIYTIVLTSRLTTEQK